MNDNGHDDFFRGSKPMHLRMARANEASFYGGPLDGSFDFAALDDVRLEWRYPNSPLTHVYERDVTGRMYYVGLMDVTPNNDAEQDGA